MVIDLAGDHDRYSEVLKAFLDSKGIWHRFIVFDQPVKTVEQAGRKVDADRIAKSIVMVASDQRPLLVILPAKNKISHRKVKTLLSVKDVRLAREAGVLAYSGYPAGECHLSTMSGEPFWTLGF